MPDPDIPNGCGPWWQPYNWHDGFFCKECTLHDKDYDNKKLSRYQADIVFLSRMLSRAKGNTYRLMQAQVFYWVARVFGWTSY